MKLNRETKHNLKVGDILKFNDSGKPNSAYIIIDIFESNRGSMSFYLRDVVDHRPIYGMPSSECYGAEIVPSEPEEPQPPENDDQLAAKITETVFRFDPHNGADREDMTETVKNDLNSLAGCHAIIEELCNMILYGMD